MVEKENTMPSIELRNITKKFGDFVAVDNLSLDIKDGDFITLLGPSGCGKTTTLRQIAGLEMPTSGEILIDGKVVFSSEKSIDVAPKDRGVGFLFQNYALWPHMTVYKNIAFGLENLKWKKPDIDKRVKELLKLLKIEEFPDRYPAELSGGQQQRVAIARTLATNPRVLLMDEPLSNLDAKLRMEMRAELKRLHHETGATFVYVTHDQLEAMTLATKICLLDRGYLQQYDPPLTVYNRPRNKFVADFVGNPTMNLISFSGERKDDHTCVLSHRDMKLEFTTTDVLPAEMNEVTIGVRPENVLVTEGDGIEVKVDTSLPSGMETILNLKAGEDVMLSCVMIGSVDYPSDSVISVRFKDDQVLLFDGNGDFSASGSVRFI